MNNLDEAKRRGPVPGPQCDKYTVRLEPVDAEWAKRTSEGLSGMIRRLLKKEKEQDEQR